MARVLLGVSGGIAGYKALELVRLATAAGHSVRAVQTPAAQRFVGAASFAALTGAPVLVDEFEHDPARGAFPDQAAPQHAPIGHLELVRNADAYLIAPASANTLAKLAHGLADNMLTSAALAARCPIVVAPAMNDGMWESPATRANVETLRARGVTVVEPGAGRLASKGEWGAGRLPDPAELLGAVEAVLAPAAGPGPQRHLLGLHVLVSAGGTREPIDAVRYVGNRSSGRMGLALAVAAADRGATVTCVAANVALERDPRVTYVDVQTAAQLEEACAAAFPRADVLLMAAAVADFRPVEPAVGKVTKLGRDGLTVTMEPTVDVLGALAARRQPGQILVGFAAEHGDGALARAREKRERKGVDAVVVNDVSRPGIGFDTAANEVTVVTADGERHVPRADKAAVADVVLEDVVRLRAMAVSSGESGTA
ncbi:MAG TPA: bifunctional phosphopantothenoylcysteine decarboxylase/phosphopantothenate--cysteine ligase CoaBC [Solirubrobacteraceae bacterium]|nr:bifunctional phosphopantothenoylcysteine decarboxylase/phosphopantothenate--cysteine ligase CoaBC [Solirubrobacteraceae bacterium]